MFILFMCTSVHRLNNEFKKYIILKHNSLLSKIYLHTRHNSY